jgi:hypothetical protein
MFDYTGAAKAGEERQRRRDENWEKFESREAREKRMQNEEPPLGFTQFATDLCRDHAKAIVEQHKLDAEAETKIEGRAFDHRTDPKGES